MEVRFRTALLCFGQAGKAAVLEYLERVDIITGIDRRRRHSANAKVRLVEQTLQPGMTVSAVAH
jgi:transposase-like protein